MASKITPEQLADLQAHVGEPVPVQDDTGNVVCYMLGAVDFDDVESPYNQRLQALLKEGDESADVSAEDARRQVEQHTQELTDKYA